MNIGEAARRSGVSARMIRYYEQMDLIPPAIRRDSGYRDYSEREVHMLRFIGRARDLGFAMTEIRELLDLWQDRNRRSADVKRIAEARLDDIERRIAEMRSVADTLRDLARCCAGDTRPDCPILDDLARIDDTGSDLPETRGDSRRKLLGADRR
jgi:MerR family gold-responsive transcriptional activator of gol and ges genes